MRSRTLGSLALAALALLFTQTAVHATPITFDFAGHVTFVGDPFGLVGSLINQGDPVHVSLRYDTSSGDGYPDDPTRGAYITPGWLKVAINGLDFQNVGFNQIDVLHNFDPCHCAVMPPQETLFATAFDSVTTWPVQLPIFPHTRIGIAIGQTPPPFSLFSSDALPSSIDFSIANLLNGGVTTSASDGLNMYEVQFDLSPVPEPETWSLLGSGLLLFSFARSTFSFRRKRLREADTI